MVLMNNATQLLERIIKENSDVSDIENKSIEDNNEKNEKPIMIF